MNSHAALHWNLHWQQSLDLLVILEKTSTFGHNYVRPEIMSREFLYDFYTDLLTILSVAIAETSIGERSDTDSSTITSRQYQIIN